MTGEVKKWKKISYISANIIVTDWFYAKSPDLRDNVDFPFTGNAEYTTVSQHITRSTVEEVDQQMEKHNEEMAKTINQSNT